MAKAYRQGVHCEGHFNSIRKDSFIAVNCAAIPDNLLESELFGYIKGLYRQIMTKGLFEQQTAALSS